LFFFQAEDGIRDFHVTGVQTCALPISVRPPPRGRCRPNRRGSVRAGRGGVRPPGVRVRTEGSAPPDRTAARRPCGGSAKAASVSPLKARRRPSLGNGRRLLPPEVGGLGKVRITGVCGSLTVVTPRLPTPIW